MRAEARLLSVSQPKAQKKFGYEPKSDFAFFLSSLPLPGDRERKSQKPKENQKEAGKRKHTAMALLVSYSNHACFSSLSTSSSSSSSSPYSILPITTNPGEIISTRCSSLLFSFLFFYYPFKLVHQEIQKDQEIHFHSIYITTQNKLSSHFDILLIKDHLSFCRIQ